MRPTPASLLLTLAVAAAPAPLAAQSIFSLAARSGYTGLTGDDFDGAGGALILDLSLRYGRRNGFAAAAGGHFSNHTVADTVNLDVVGAYLEGRYTFPTVQDNVLPFATLRGGWQRQVFTTGSGGGTQDATQDGFAVGATLGVDYELSERIDVEIAGLYQTVSLDDASTASPRPRSSKGGCSGLKYSPTETSPLDFARSNAPL